MEIGKYAINSRKIVFKILKCSAKGDGKMKDVVIVIPSYKPHKEIMSEFIENLTKHFKEIVVVDDGSGIEYSDFFNKLENIGITVLKHNINLGKGRAIKTAFNYCLNTYENINGTVTADCDGQHSVKDIIKCAEKLQKMPEKLIIGTRNFDEKQVPIKSKFGNKLTKIMFSIFVGIKISDTQSGLRGFGIENMKNFLQIAGERYEYETNMLIECKQKEIGIEEVPIETVYIKNNELSHFNPLKDSIMIYKLFLKYIISSVSSFVVDILLFSLFLKYMPEINIGIITTIVIATILARIMSSIYNFIINSKLVFKNKNKTSIIKYFILVIVQMFISAFIVSEIFNLFRINATVIKIVVDAIIFIINFVIQREFIFKNNK